MKPPFAELALLPRAIVIGSVTAGTIGSIAGLVVGLFVYAPTAPFAAIELGIPATITGALTGLITGSLILATQRIIRGPASRPSPASDHRSNLGPAPAAHEHEQPGRGLRVLTVAGETIAGAALIASAEFLPWVSYQVNGSPLQGDLNAGPIGIALVAIGGASIALAAAQAASRKPWPAVSCCVLGGASFVLTVLAAATRIAYANSMTNSTGGSTSFASGILLAAAAAVAIAIAPIAQLSNYTSTDRRD